MADTRKNVFLLCEPQPGVTRQRLIHNLATLFKKDGAAIEKMLDRPRFLIKKDVDATVAAKYQSAIAQAGGRCEVVSHELALAAVIEKPELPPQSPQHVQPPQPAGKKRLTIVVLLFGLIILLALVFVGYQKYRSPTGLPVESAVTEATPEQVVPALNKRLFSDDRHLSINVPDSWQERKGLSEGASIGAINPAAEVYVIVMAEPREDFSEDYSLSKYTDVVLKLMREIMLNLNVQGELRNFKIKGLPAEQLVMTGRVDKNDITYLLTTVETDRGFFQILSWTRTSRYQINQRLMQEISESFVARSFPEF